MNKAIWEKASSLYQDYLANYQGLLEATQLFTKQFSQEIGAEDLNVFNRQREQQFIKLQKCQTAIAQMWEDNPNLNLSGDEQKKIDQLTNSLKTVMEEIVKQDELISNKLSMDLERIKLELHRWQSFKRLKNTYRGPITSEARFVDKNR